MGFPVIQADLVDHILSQKYITIVIQDSSTDSKNNHVSTVHFTCNLKPVT